jgi:uncharacterized protein (UPF0332 family)
MRTESIVEYWLEKAEEDLASAGENFQAGRLSNAIRDAYYACFHAFSAVLLQRGIHFKKHREVRAILHRDFIRAKEIRETWGRHYDWLIDNRQKADYRPLAQFDTDQVKEIIQESRGFVMAMRKMVENGVGPNAIKL